MDGLTREDYEACGAEHIRFSEAEESLKQHRKTCKVCASNLKFVWPRVGSLAIQWHPKNPNVRLGYDDQFGSTIECIHYLPEDEAKIGPEGNGFILPKEPSVLFYLTRYGVAASTDPKRYNYHAELCRGCRKDLNDSVAELISSYRLKVD